MRNLKKLGRAVFRGMFGRVASTMAPDADAKKHRNVVANEIFELDLDDQDQMLEDLPDLPLPPEYPCPNVVASDGIIPKPIDHADCRCGDRESHHRPVGFSLDSQVPSSRQVYRLKRYRQGL